MSRMRRWLRSWVKRPVQRLRGDFTQAELRKRGLRLGTNVYVGEGARFDHGFLWLISIGDNTTISADVHILAHDAAMKQSVGYSRIARVSIGSGVYIGAHAVVLPGVIIGDRAIVGAGSVVTHDVPEGMVAAGNPARIIRPVDAFLNDHRRMLTIRPTYPAKGWTFDGDITAEDQERMRADLRDGPGYVE